jgi:hypothetical protein
MDPKDIGKRKMVEKDHHRRGQGRSSIANSSGASPHGRGDRGGMISTLRMRKGRRCLVLLQMLFLTPHIISLSLMANI